MKKKLQTAFSPRQYMLEKEFEIYYYSDKNVKPVESHTHNYYEFYFFLQDNVSLSINGTAFPLRPHDFIIIPPKTHHYPIIHNYEEPNRRFVLWISQDYYNQLLSNSQIYGYLTQYVVTAKQYVFNNDRITFNGIQSMIFRLIEEIKGERFGRSEGIRLHLNALILHLNRIVHERNHKRHSHIERNLYREICDYITGHLDEDLSLDKLASEFYVNKFYISHLFKDNIGVSPHQYIMKQRLMASKDAILGNASISKVFSQYGFHDYSSYYRAFKKEYGIGPNEFRKQSRLADTFTEDT